MNAPLTVAAGQASCVALDVAANVATAARLVRLAADQGAELVVLPELFLTGPELTAIVVEPAKYAIGETDSRLDPLADACADSRTAAVVGAPVWEDGRILLSAHVLGRGGQPVGRYDKQHLTAAERAVGISAGTLGHTVGLDTWRLGVAIGEDAHHAEHARAAARDGCQVYLVGTPLDRPGPPEPMVTERAADNGLYPVLAGRAGSGIWHPEGERLAEAGGDPSVAVATLERL
jgi:5-aminopentanamidase